MNFKNKGLRMDVNGMLCKVEEEEVASGKSYKGGEEKIWQYGILNYRYTGCSFYRTQIVPDLKEREMGGRIHFERCWFDQAVLLMLGHRLSEIIFTDCVFTNEAAVESGCEMEALNIHVKDIIGWHKVNESICDHMEFVNCRAFNNEFVDIVGNGEIGDIRIGHCRDLSFHLHNRSYRKRFCQKMMVEHCERLNIQFEDDISYFCKGIDCRFSHLDSLSFGGMKVSQSERKTPVKLEYSVIDELRSNDNIELVNDCSLVCRDVKIENRCETNK